MAKTPMDDADMAKTPAKARGKGSVVVAGETAKPLPVAKVEKHNPINNLKHFAHPPKKGKKK